VLTASVDRFAAARAAASGYRGRFAPSPTGLLHAGSLVAALASWLHARAHGGRWLVRIEDVDAPRSASGADHAILAQLAQCGLVSDEPVVWQSQRSALYREALQSLLAQGQAYPCTCSRKDIASALAAAGRMRTRHGELAYPGTCRAGCRPDGARAWRLRLRDDAVVHWHDERLGLQTQDVMAEVGDFVLQRSDGWFSYQLAVVVDDAAQGVTHVVRGEDLADNTARQIVLQRALGLPQPQYCHMPLVMGDNGEKLSKQNGAQALDLSQPLAALNAAARVLGLPAQSHTVADALRAWTAMFAQRLHA